MEVNSNKAGMDCVDKEKVNAIIREASKDSTFAKHQAKKQAIITDRIQKQKLVIESFSDEKIRIAELQANQMMESFEAERNLNRQIVHIDMDCFFAAVEMRDNPKLRSVPMAVGSNSMLSTSNYLARKFGVRAGQPGFIGKKLCPTLVIVPPNFDKYRETSHTVKEVLLHYDPNLSMSIDEAYLDITEYLMERNSSQSQNSHARKRYFGPCCCKIPYCPEVSDSNRETLTKSSLTEEMCHKCSKLRFTIIDEISFGSSVEEVTNEMRFKINEATGLTASAGICVNGMLAKVCSDINKPNGQFFLEPDKEKILEFVSKLPIRKVPGIGAVSEALLKAIGVKFCGNFHEKRGLIFLLYSPSSASFFLRVACGIGAQFTISESKDNDRKSISVERTFGTEISDPVELKSMCKSLSDSLAEDVKNEHLKGKTVTIKLKTIEFDVKTRAATLNKYISSSNEIFEAALALLEQEQSQIYPEKLRLRLLGVRLSSLLQFDQPEPKMARIENSITRYLKPTLEDSIDKDEITILDDFPLQSSEIISKRISPQCSKELENPVAIKKRKLAPKSGKSQKLITEDTNDNLNHCKLLDNDIKDDFVCPVCNFKLKSVKSLSKINEHVDRCLNRQTISEMLSN